MAIRTDVTIDWSISPRLLTIASPSSEISVQEIVDTCRYFEDSRLGIDYEYLIDAAGKEPLGGNVSVGITATLNNAYIAFEARPGPSWELCRISGGNLVAVDGVGAELDPRYPTAFTTVDRTASSSATLQDQDALNYASYNGGVTVDINSSYNGTGYPIGTPQQPVNNLTDALTIAEDKGFTAFYILGDITIDFSLDFRQYSFIGESIDKTTITIEANAQVEKSEFYEASIQGTLDGEAKIKNSLIKDINYISGYVELCVLAGEITLGGGANSYFLDCWAGTKMDDPSIIDMGGSGQTLVMQNFNGTIKIVNKTGTNDEANFSLNAGIVILDPTVTAGNVNVIGTGALIDNSDGTAVINVEYLVNAEIMTNKIWDDDISNRYVPNSAATALKAGTYGGFITLDTVNGSAGTGWPIGTHFNPVNNLDDALAIMSRGNVDKLMLHSNLTIEAHHDISGIIVETAGKMGVDITFESGCRTHQTAFRYVNLQGALTGGDQLLVENASIFNLENFTGIMNNVAFGEGAEISVSSWATIIQATAGGEPTNEPELNIGDAKVNISNYTGNLKLTNKTGNNRTVANFNSGNILIDSSCVQGTIQLLGTGIIESDDSGPGCQVDSDGFISIRNITDNVWDEDLTDHVTEDSSGEEIKNIKKDTGLIPGTL